MEPKSFIFHPFFLLFPCLLLVPFSITFPSKITHKRFVGRPSQILIFDQNHWVLPYELDVPLFGRRTVFQCFATFFTKKTKKPSKNQAFRAKIPLFFWFEFRLPFLMEKWPFWGAILAPWTPQGPPFLVKMGWPPLRGSSFFQKCVRWSPSGRPKWPQGSPKDPPRPPQGHFLATFGPLWVTFWWILTTFGRLFGHFCSRLEMFLEFHWFP